jgi:phytoene dehydrogenase-like protein
VAGKVSYDAVVVGAGPNGLAAAIRLAQAHLSVLLLEANESVGGATRSSALTLPGFIHDVCSAVHPLAFASPYFRQLHLEKFGLGWVHPEIPLAHPLDGGQAALLQSSVSATVAGLGPDGPAYASLMGPLAETWESLLVEVLQPLLHRPRHPAALARFGLRALGSAAHLAKASFAHEPARALFAGLAAHAFLPLEQRASAAFGLVLGMLGHAVGWPLARGGSQQIAEALAACFRSLGGEIATHTPVDNLGQLPLARAVILDVTPLQLLLLAGDKLPDSYIRRLGRYRYGPGVFKVDYALARPVPWQAHCCARAGTVHLGGSLEEIADAERTVAEGRLPERPFVLFAQPSLFDPSRAPAGKHTAWAYCHVPNGSTFDMAARIESQIERFAPGFRDLVLARHTINCVEMERRNANLVGGDINGGAANFRQLLARPVCTPAPYRTPVPGLYLCSSSTPPGGGVHGMCGFHAAQTVLHDLSRSKAGSSFRARGQERSSEL